MAEGLDAGEIMQEEGSALVSRVVAVVERRSEIMQD